MSLRSLLDRSRDALYALTFRSPPTGTAAPAEDVGMSSTLEGLFNGIGLGLGHGNVNGDDIGEHHIYGHGLPGYLGLGQIRTVLFWMSIILVVLLFAVLSNPNETSFRSHLTELSFRRHFVEFRNSDTTQNQVSDQPSTESESPTPFRFANHVSISLRTPPLVYRTFLFFSLVLTSPPNQTPNILTITDPLSRKASGGKEKAVIFIGFLGYWTFLGDVAILEWFIRFFGDGTKEKAKRRERPGILELKAVPSKDDPAVAIKPMLLTPKAAKVEQTVDNHLPLSPPPPLSRRPSIVGPPVDVPDSPLVISLKADLAAAQATLAELESQLVSQESSTDPGLIGSLEDLRNKRKEDDNERQELKSRTKSLEEQKRQAESAKREAEKKLKAVETLRDTLEAKIAAAREEMSEVRGNMEASEKNVRSIQEEGARHIVEIQNAIEEKKQEMESCEAQLVDLDYANEELGKLIAAAEVRLKTAGEAAEQRASPEEEMMMMAAAYEAAAQEGYQNQNQNSWANQAAAYMAEAGMPYLDQHYTARPPRPSGNTTQPDVSGFEDFGPVSSNTRDIFHPQHPLAPPASLGQASHSLTRPDPESEEEVEIDPGSPNGTSFLPQGLFRSLEGDATPLDLEEHEYSGSDSGDELWRSPGSGTGSGGQVHNSIVNSAMTTANPSSNSLLRRLLPPSSTTPPNAPALPGLPALPGGRRWFSGTSSSDNVAFNFMHATGTGSSDSLLYEPSPFAPTSSEKRALALKWPLKNYRWSRGGAAGNADGGLDGADNSSQFQPQALQVEHQANGSIIGSGSPPNSNGWLSSRFHNSNSAGNLAGLHSGLGHASSSRGFGGLGRAASNSTDLLVPPSAPTPVQEEDEDDKAEKKPFRFFSLRKTPSSAS